MTDYADWQEWADEAAFELMKALRDTDWIFKTTDRKEIYARFDRLAALRAELTRYAPESWALDEDGTPMDGMEGP